MTKGLIPMIPLNGKGLATRKNEIVVVISAPETHLDLIVLLKHGLENFHHRTYRIKAVYCNDIRLLGQKIQEKVRSVFASKRTFLIIHMITKRTTPSCLVEIGLVEALRKRRVYLVEDGVDMKKHGGVFVDDTLEYMPFNRRTLRKTARELARSIIQMAQEERGLINKVRNEVSVGAIVEVLTFIVRHL